MSEPSGCSVSPQMRAFLAAGRSTAEFRQVSTGLLLALLDAALAAKISADVQPGRVRSELVRARGLVDDLLQVWPVAVAASDVVGEDDMDDDAEPADVGS